MPLAKGPVCHVTNCRGVRAQGDRCVAHIKRDSEREDYLSGVARTGVFDARGVRISGSRLDALLDAARRERGGPLAAVLLDTAVVEGESWPVLHVSHYASLAGIEFTGPVGMTLEAGCPVSLEGALFRDTFSAVGAKAARLLSLGSARFEQSVDLSGSVITGKLVLSGATFLGPVYLTGLEAGLGLDVSGVVFQERLTLDGAYIGHRAEEAERAELEMRGDWWDELAGVTHDVVPALKQDQDELIERHRIRHVTRFENVNFRSETRFDYFHARGKHFAFSRVRFDDAASFDSGTIGCEQVVIQDVRCAQRLRIRADCTVFDMRRSNFVEGADIEFAADAATVEDCRFAEPSVVRALDVGPRPARLAPPLYSLRRTDCRNLRLVDVNLAPCHFGHAHNLDQLVIEGPLRLAAPPPPRRAARRRVIAEEWAWRERHDGWPTPYEVDWRDPTGEGWLPDIPADLDTVEIAALYRALRKGSEDAKDEPGAADFYYGEMEMRRHTPGSAQRLVVWAYWALSGYAPAESSAREHRRDARPVRRAVPGGGVRRAARDAAAGGSHAERRGRVRARRPDGRHGSRGRCRRPRLHGGDGNGHHQRPGAAAHPRGARDAGRPADRRAGADRTPRALDSRPRKALTPSLVDTQRRCRART